MTTAPQLEALAACEPKLGVAPTDPEIVRVYRQWQEQSRLVEGLRVVFVVGPPKTGTTWVQQTLGSHPEAAAEGEGHMADWLGLPLSVGVGEYLKRQKEVSRSDKPIEWLQHADQFFLVRQACDRVLVGYIRRAQQRGKVRLRCLIDKTPGHARHVAMLAALYPWARFVCCTRDVRDAAVSAWHHLGKVPGFFEGATDIKSAARLYAQKHWGELLRHARAAGRSLGASRYTEVAYEDYKADPVAVVKRLFEFCGLGADDAVVRAAIDANTFERRSGGRAPGQEADAFHRKGVVGDWKNYFSQDEGADLVRLAEERVVMVV